MAACETVCGENGLLCVFCCLYICLLYIHSAATSSVAVTVDHRRRDIHNRMRELLERELMNTNHSTLPAGSVTVSLAAHLPHPQPRDTVPLYLCAARHCTLS